MRPEKKAIIEELQQTLSESDYVLLADCGGMDVDAMYQLRTRMSETASSVQVVKNSFLGHAAKSAGMDGMQTLLEGPTAMITGGGDVAAVAKALKAFIKERDKPAIKGGYTDDAVLSADDVITIASIPPREILLGQFVGTVAAPMSQLVGVMNQKIASLVYVLQAVADKKAAE